MKWSKQTSKIEQINHILDNEISNLEPSLRKHLYELAFLNLDLTKENLKTLIKNNMIKTPPPGGTGKYYWISRGWDEEIAKAKYKLSRENKPKKISPFSIDFWLEKINPDTDELFTLEEADVKRNSLRPIKPEYWVSKGYSEEDAISKAIETKSKNNISGAKGAKSKSKSSYRNTSKRCKEYWSCKGYDEKTAILKVKEYQTMFSLETCIQKYGEIKGKQKFIERQNLWQNTLNSKSDEEIERINKSKLSNGFSISKAEKEIFETLKSEFPNLKIQHCLKNSDNKRWIYDLCLNNKIIEYNGSYWHADPRFYTPQSLINHKTAVEVWENDRLKIENAYAHNYEVLIIWEHDYKRNKSSEIEKCLTFLRT